MTTSADQHGDEIGGSALLDEYLTDLTLQGRTAATVKSYRSNVRIFLDWLDSDPGSITRRDLRGFLNHLTTERTSNDGTPGLSVGTVENYFKALTSFYKFLKYEGYIQDNIIPEFRERYVESVSYEPGKARQLISVEEMGMLVHGTLNVRDRAIILLLAKTGVRRNELQSMDLSDINWEEQLIRLKDTPKRTNTVVFFDSECHRVLERWIRAREEEAPETEALFSNLFGNRLERQGILMAVSKHAEAVGLHDPDSHDPQKRFTPHCCRHWFTTHLRRSGMQREFIQELRGDTRGDAIDIYDHIDKDELRESYLAHIPSLGL